MRAHEKFKAAMFQQNYARALFIADEISAHSPNIGQFLRAVATFHSEDDFEMDLVRPEEIRNVTMRGIASIFKAESLFGQADDAVTTLLYTDSDDDKPTNITLQQWKTNPSVLSSFFISLAEIGATRPMASVVERWTSLNNKKLMAVNEGLVSHIGKICLSLIQNDFYKHLVSDIIYCLDSTNLAEVVNSVFDAVGEQRFDDNLYKKLSALLSEFIVSEECNLAQMLKVGAALCEKTDAQRALLVNKYQIKEKFPKSSMIKAMLLRAEIASNLNKWPKNFQEEIDELLVEADFEVATSVVYEIPFATNAVAREIENLSKLNQISSTLPIKAQSSSAEPKHQDILQLTFSSHFLHNHGIGHAMANIVPYLQDFGIRYDLISFGELQDDKYAKTIRSHATGVTQIPRSEADYPEKIMQASLPEPSDVLIDLDGLMYTGSTFIGKSGRWPLLMYWIGHGGKLGLDFYDYVIADKFVLEKYPTDFGEKHICLPDSFVSWSAEPPSSVFTREKLGFDENAIIFNCFNNLKKITTEYLDALVSISKKVDHPVFWFNDAKRRTQAWNILGYLDEAGVKKRHVRFGIRLHDKANHFSRLSVSDLGLDTFTNNMASGALDLLWAEVPVVSLPGETYNSRSCGSFNRTIGLSACNVSSVGEYIDLAIELANSPAKLKQMKSHLAATKSRSSLFDGRLFAEQFSKGIKAAVQRSREGKPPEHMYV